MAEPEYSVSRRRVIYIPGYDPFHPRRYRELYRKESAAQAGISGYEIGLEARKGQGPFAWTVRSNIEGQPVETRMDVLVWSDIVKGSMSGTILGTYAQLVRTAWTYISTGALFRLMRLRKGPVIAALYPVVFLLIQLMLAIIVGVFGGYAVGSLGAWLISFVSGPEDQALGGLAIAVMTMPLVAVGVLQWFRRKDNKFFAYYLMHDYSYSARSRGDNAPELEARMAEFRAVIAEALTSDVDEVLVIGHSSGAHLGISVLADLIRCDELPENGPELSFLTLGQVVPMVSFLPDAHRLREDLHFLCQRDELTWVDVTAPGDGCAFALCDPVSVSGVAPETGKRWPLVLSAAFTQTLSPEQWDAKKWKFFQLHFQYLCAFDRPGSYDYFKITAGPQTLAQRLGHRKPSKSLIDTAANRFTSRKQAA